jgi:dTDP-4-amino-4,6-dideoxygalactose transaminase
VITSPYTWHLQAGQILALRALPVFCDINPRTACIEPDAIRRNITPRTKAIAVVHPFGCVAPMEEICALAKERGIPVIEDCSHAHGATCRGRKVGTFGDIGCFSLQASKLMNAIEGGILVTDNERYYERACLLAHYERLPQANAPDIRRFYDPARENAPACFGFKYRIHPLGAAIARVQLRHLDRWNAVRRQNMGYLTRRFAEVGRGLFEPPYEAEEMARTWLNYICLFHAERAGCSRERFIEALRAEGLPARGGRAGYLPIYWNPLYQERVSMWAEGDPFDSPAASPITYERGLCPVAERLWRQCVDLPMLHAPVSAQLLDEIVEAVEKVICHLEELGGREAGAAAVEDAAVRPPALAERR